MRKYHGQSSGLHRRGAMDIWLIATVAMSMACCCIVVYFLASTVAEQIQPASKAFVNPYSANMFRNAAAQSSFVSTAFDNPAGGYGEADSAGASSSPNLSSIQPVATMTSRTDASGTLSAHSALFGPSFHDMNTSSSNSEISSIRLSGGATSVGGAR
jgi:hypothetical protein